MASADQYGSAKNYGGSGYGHGVPSLPPFGAAASHPKYGYGYAGHGSNEYVTARRYLLPSTILLIYIFHTFHKS